ncbi:LOW QUALITY PROTEIN: uncharacterized protein LOC116920127 [Daphnia magna]|uniref:LOW QUALITY PROTEIN: uncharacterized protein LOC116920127 n=1 Tax=Daphnia magna TaxID=35525 RepID=UPI001E1BD27D|nr:LOW QUALITY PROTEIN: uncharacterized protein LOC116920127 [Daphnia magna]
MSLEFVYSSEGCEEFVALCANPALIEDRVDRSRHRNKTEVSSIRLNCKYRVYASFEILLENSADSNVIVPSAIFMLCRHFTYDQLIELIEFFVRSDVEIHHASTGSASVSFLCRCHIDNVINLIETLVQHDCISSRICDALVQVCRNGVDDLINRIRTLINRGIENVRLDCDSVNGNVAEDVQTILLKLNADDINSRTDKCQLKSVFKSCRATVHVKMHSPLHQRMIYNHQIDHVDESGLLSFNTRENSIFLPAFRDWQTIHVAWHCPDIVAGQIDQLIFSYLDKHSHRRELCDKSAGACDWCRVGSDVDDYLNRLMDKVEEMCSLFAAERLIHYGSSAEKTNIFRASEFDRGVVLNNFGQSPSDPNQIVYTGNDPAYVALKDGEYPINSSSLLVLFMKSITDAVERVHSVHVFAPTVAFGETCVTVYFLYRGRHPSAAVKVSVDVTIAVKAAEQPAMISNGWFVSDEVEGVVLLVPHRRGVGSQWRLSYPTLERDMLLHAGEQVSRVYQLLKFLAALHHAKDNLKREIPRKSSLSSYALKTCLFRYMRHHYRPPPWQPEDALRHTVGILRQFPINSCEMTSYFNKEIVVFNVTPKSRKAVAEIISVLNKLL